MILLSLRVIILKLASRKRTPTTGIDLVKLMKEDDQDHGKCIFWTFISVTAVDQRRQLTGRHLCTLCFFPCASSAHLIAGQAESQKNVAAIK